MTDLAIRSIAAGDGPAWRRLWAGCRDDYRTALPEAVCASMFARLLSDNPRKRRGLFAVCGGVLAGLAHCVFRRHCRRIEDTGCLRHPCTDPGLRGRRAGRRLIEAVHAAADAAGCPSEHWLTEEFDCHGRMLRDRVGARIPFIRCVGPLG